NSEQTVRAFANNASHLDSLVIHADSVLTQVDAALGGESANITKTVQLLGKQGGTVDKLSSFTYLLGLLGANLLNKDTSDPHDIFAVNGINGAIDNVQSAFASSDACPKPLSPANHCSVSPDGRQHYLRVQTFNFPPSFCGLPLFSGGGGPIPCPSSSSGAPSVPFRAALTGDELNSLGAVAARRQPSERGTDLCEFLPDVRFRSDRDCVHDAVSRHDRQSNGAVPGAQSGETRCARDRPGARSPRRVGAGPGHRGRLTATGSHGRGEQRAQRVSLLRRRDGLPRPAAEGRHEPAAAVAASAERHHQCAVPAGALRGQGGQRRAQRARRIPAEGRGPGARHAGEGRGCSGGKGSAATTV